MSCVDRPSRSHHEQFQTQSFILRMSLIILLYKSVPLVCVCVCVFFPHSFWTSSSLDVPAGVTQEEGHTGFLIHLLSAVHALVFPTRRVLSFLSLVDRVVEFCVLTI